MPIGRRDRFAVAACVLALAGAVAVQSAAQDQNNLSPQLLPFNALQNPQLPPTHSLGNDFTGQAQLEQMTGGSVEALLKTPVSNLHPGNVRPQIQIKNPYENDPSAAARGMQYFNSFNCVGCHAPNGGGGIGPALSNRTFIYGSEPAQIYLSIVQGRPNGMPAWGSALPADVVWSLVTYIQQISQEPTPEWGMTISPTSPSIEQVPAEYQMSDTPWAYTEPFSEGQQPERGKPSP